jgi:hypothetical protein
MIKGIITTPPLKKDIDQTDALFSSSGSWINNGRSSLQEKSYHVLLVDVLRGINVESLQRKEILYE